MESNKHLSNPWTIVEASAQCQKNTGCAEKNYIHDLESNDHIIISLIDE